MPASVFMYRRRLSPNDDGTNDLFTLLGPSADVAGIAAMRVYNRWGSLVYEMNGLPNDVSGGWDGRNADGRVLPTGVYLWYATMVLFDGSVREMSGEVTLVR